MWNYEQKSGILKHNAVFVAVGYSGSGPGKNNPDLERVVGVGPLPTGKYKVGEPHDTVMHGPFVMALWMEPGFDAFERSGFLCHGDSISHPGSASHGCLILPRDVREQIANSGDAELFVVSGI